MSEEIRKIYVTADNSDNPHDVELAKKCEDYLNFQLEQIEFSGAIINDIELALVGGGIGQA